MKKVILLRYGEIHLKGKNRGTFENILLENIRKSVKDFSCKIKRIAGRYLVTDFNENDEEILINKLSKVFGLVSLSVAVEVETNQEMIQDMAVLSLQELSKKIDISGKTFKVKASRADKKFPINSDKFSAIVGEIILNNFPELKVNVHNPDIELIIDIRENGKTYILSYKHKCVGGMPVGSGGQGLLMLSGGIDSPVAGYLMAKRGMKINAIHFHSFPYTSVQAKEKVIKLAGILTDYVGNIRLFVVPFTKIQEQIHINCKENYMISIMRRMMIRIAEKICENNNLKTIITGESLGQVASQTIESITVTNNVLKTVPMMRPLIAFDKTEIIEIAQKIGTFETSILPYEDCCTVFLPKSPIIKPTVKNAEKQESYLNTETLINEAIENIEVLII